MIVNSNARGACRLLVAMCLSYATLAAGQDAPSTANSNSQTSTSVPSQPESRPAQDQNNDSTGSQNETRTPPVKKQPRANNAKATASHAAAPKRAPAAPSPGAPKKIVVREGGAEEPTAQIVTGMTAEEADRQRHEAELLLSTTAETLKEISPRPLDSQQQETVSQIHNYMEGSRIAMKEGDIPRAHILALKAQLLADDLAKR
ncbi:MAG: hypothetical protein WBV36_26545 [Terriglobales bacterium]